MASVERRYSKETIARRGDAIYERDIRPKLKRSDKDKFIAIDVETGDSEIATDARTASQRLRARVPQAQIWLVRVGSPYVYRLGGAGTRFSK
jgi:hypothetical protein